MTILFLIIILLFCFGASVLLYKIIIDSAKGKGNWGINVNLPNCPNCVIKLPAVRSPTSVHQALWGGWTCSNCACEIDKWGKEINAAKNNTTQKQIQDVQVDFVNSFDEKGKTPVEKVFEENNK